MEKVIGKKNNQIVLWWVKEHYYGIVHFVLIKTR